MSNEYLEDFIDYLGMWEVPYYRHRDLVLLTVRNRFWDREDVDAANDKSLEGLANINNRMPETLKNRIREIKGHRRNYVVFHCDVARALISEAWLRKPGDPRFRRESLSEN